jgi:hypothetical protein
VTAIRQDVTAIKKINTTTPLLAVPPSAQKN